MRQIKTAKRRDRRSRQGHSIQPQQPPEGTERSAAAPGLTTLARGGGIIELPTLRGVRARYEHETNGSRLYGLCRALVTRGLGDEKLWEKVGEVPTQFAQSIVHGLIDTICGDSLTNTLEFSCEIRDNLGTGRWKGKPVDDGHLAVLFDAERYGVVAIGAAVRALESEEEFLGASFYLLLCNSLYRWMRIYTHWDAEMYDENLHEWAEQDDPQNRDSYEFPLLAEAIPECVKVLEKNEGRTVKDMRSLLRKHRTGSHRVWIEKALTIHRLSRSNRRLMQFEGEYDYPPRPTLLIVFRENDAIHACFDNESDSFNQGDNEPACAVCFRPESDEDCEGALRTAATFLKLVRELAELVKLLNEWEEEDARQRRHRAESSLLANGSPADLQVQAGPLQ